MLIGGALGLIVVLVLLLVMVNQDEDNADPAAPSSTAGDSGGSSGTSEKSVSSPLPKSVGAYQNNTGGSVSSSSYSPRDDPSTVMVVVPQSESKSAEEYAESAALSGVTREGDFLCGEGSGQVQCVTQLSDGVLVVLGSEDKATTSAFSRELLNAI